MQNILVSFGKKGFNSWAAKVTSCIRSTGAAESSRSVIRATRLVASEDALSSSSMWSTRGAEWGRQVHIQLERDTMWWGIPLPCRQMQAHPGQSHDPLCMLTQQMATNKLKEGTLLKIWASKSRKTCEDMTALWKNSQDDCAECGPDGADISTQLRASWHWAYESSTGTESEWQWRTCTYCTARCQHSSFTCRKLSSSAAHPQCPFKNCRLLQKRG